MSWTMLADVDQQVHALDQLNEVNICKFILYVQQLPEQQNKRVCTFSVDAMDERIAA